MRYVEYPPHPSLAPFVRCFWLMADDNPACADRVERIVPDGCIEVIIHYASTFRALHDADNQARNQRSIIAGQITRCLHLQPTGRIGMVGIRFEPGGAAAFLRLSMDALSDRVAPLEAAWGPIAAELEERVCAAKTDHERIRLLQMALMSRREQAASNFDNVVSSCVSRAASAGGTLSMDQLIAVSGMSGRQLERRFHRVVGITPKFLCRIMRFRRIFDIVERHDSIDWRSAALACGYYDQAHLIRDFRAFADRSPAAFIAEEDGMARCLTQRAEKGSPEAPDPPGALSNLSNTPPIPCGRLIPF